MKVSAPHRGWTSGRATPSLRPTPYAAETANPAGRHLSFAEICPDNRSQLYRPQQTRRGARHEREAMILNPMPKAKTEHLIVKVIDDETLVYDHGRATCLNEFAARVWRQCDGETSVADIADALGEDERAVWMALHELNKSKLLVEEIALPPDMRTGKTRRAIAGQLGLGAAVAAVSSIVMTTAAHASCSPAMSPCNSSGECCSSVCSIGLCQ